MRPDCDLSVQLQRSLVVLVLVYLMAACGASASIQPSATPRPTSAASIATVTPVQAAVSTALDPTAAAAQARDLALRPAEAQMETDGRALFELRCAPCHGLNGEGVIGPSFRDRPLLTVPFVLDRVRSGPQIMSAFDAAVLPDEQVALIVEYLQAEIVGRDLIPPTEAQLVEARELYRTYCTECHGVFGQGRENLGAAINRWPPLSISRIVEGGLLPLPNMPRLQVTPDELRLIALYVQSLAK